MPKRYGEQPFHPRSNFSFGSRSMAGCGQQSEGAAMRHGLQVQANCALCDQADESSDHLLASCVFSREVWFQLLRLTGLQNLAPGSDAVLVDWWLRTRMEVPSQFRWVSTPWFCSSRGRSGRSAIAGLSRVIVYLHHSSSSESSTRPQHGWGAGFQAMSLFLTRGDS